jgi:hypothetical protein
MAEPTMPEPCGYCSFSASRRTRNSAILPENRLGVVVQAQPKCAAPLPKVRSSAFRRPRRGMLQNASESQTPPCSRAWPPKGGTTNLPETRFHSRETAQFFPKPAWTSLIHSETDSLIPNNRVRENHQLSPKNHADLFGKSGNGGRQPAQGSASKAGAAARPTRRES